MNKKCQIFTPKNYVEKLLDCVKYNEHLYNKKILENACGDGKILVTIIQRYINDCLKNKLSKNTIQKGLFNDIYAYEIDKKYYKKCIKNVNQVLKDNDIGEIEWHIYNEDYLKAEIDIKFDYIISNPPYITYKELPIKERFFLKENFLTCKKGKYDYCYAFIEKSINSLKNNGKMSYLIPSSIFKVVSGYALRTLMKKNLIQIDDYTTEKLFNNALVASAIIVIDNSLITPVIHYNDIVNKKCLTIHKDSLEHKWFFKKIPMDGLKRFGNFFDVAHPVATLLNKAYVIKHWEDYDENYYLCSNHKIEKSILKEAASPRILSYRKKELIIFPYKYIDGKLVKYDLDEFEQQFPHATAFLTKQRKQLEKRKIDSHAKWFEYGRSQALCTLNTKKLLLSTIVTQKIKIYELAQDCIPYAGIFVKQKTCEYSLKDAINILTSQQFIDYAYNVGININGTSVRITVKDIMNYYF
ncbi:Eco57I restriction-modification methylase domain-containing protein [Treponema denticola]|uniref:Eco57I restriction-modification methylase domain-containing protein n=2 Tax=Treponemataceae TaxID=2845253 RepID=UPI00208FAE8D|nr:N-6 DNA methylase [Treponema denticola]